MNESTSQVQQKKVKELTRQDWNLKEYKLTNTGLVVSLAINFLGFAAIYLVLVVLQILLLGLEIEFLVPVLLQFLGLIMIILPVFFLIFALWVAVRWLNTTYVLKSGSYKVVDDFVDQKPGAVIREVKGIFQSTQIYPIQNFERAEMQKGLFASLFGYGHVRLVSKAEPKSPTVVARYLSDPQAFLFSAQQLIDSTIGANNQISS